VRANDTRFDKDLSKLNDSKITLSIMDGTTLAVIAEQDFPNAKTLGVPQMSPLSDLLLNVSSGKADAVAIDNYLAKDFVAKNPGTLKDITPKNPVRVYPNGFIIKRDEFAFKQMIDAALLEMLYSGWVDATITKYEKYSHTFYRTVKPYAQP
jgi:ABC-type amino acid transport substrate-binding protein